MRVADVIRDRVAHANEDQAMGVRLTLRAMEEPFRQIVANAGVEPSVVLNDVRQRDGSYGYNAQTEAYGDMLEMGIIDPAKVTRSALQNAASIAGLMITTEVMIADKPEPKGGAGAGMPPMGDF